MIVKNARHSISNILDNADVFDEICVVDTGSTDGTVKYIKENYPNVKLSKASWTDDFSQARNNSLSMVTGDVFMWLDADDTFSHESAVEWRNLAQQLYDAEDLDYFLLPYYYAVDNLGDPVLVQYRERIMKNPQKCVWLEPIHEVCCYKSDYTPRNEKIDKFPIIHKPDKEIDRGGRNWKILHNHLLNGNRDVRTLYYVQRDAAAMHNDEYAIVIGEELLSKEPIGYQLYEGLKILGDSYYRLSIKNNNIELFNRAVECYFKSINANPVLNEAKSALIEAYIYKNYYSEADDIANSLTIETPKTIYTINVELYEGYRWSVKTAIALSMGQFNNAFDYHLKAIESGSVTQLTYSNDLRIRKLTDQSPIIYADILKHHKKAVRIRDILLGYFGFEKVIITNNPIAVNFASTHYIHISDDEESLMQDESHPRVNKVLISDTIDYRPAGYNHHIPISDSSDTEIKRTINNDISIIYAVDAQLAIFDLRASKTHKTIIVFNDEFTNEEALEAVYDYIDENSRPLVYLNENNSPLLIAGKTSTLNQLVYIDDTIFIPNSLEFHTIHTTTTNKPHTNNTKIARLDVDTLNKDGKSIAFFAQGIEFWDGTTPHKYGIGGSESSVVYLAEELIKKGCKVTVFAPVEQECNVGCVKYIPLNEVDAYTELFEVFISSRVPEVLNKRRGKLQLLWIHDTVDAYASRIDDTIIYDQCVCVSYWQQDTLIGTVLGKRPSVVIPNGIHAIGQKIATNKTKNTKIWLSSPDRGLDNLLDIGDVYPEMSENLYVAYSFFNMTTIHRNFDMFKRCVRIKNRLRYINAKFLGRLGLPELKGVLAGIDKWVYPSSFKETFCISALEVIDSGVRPYNQSNGATSETISAYTNKTFYSVQKDYEFSKGDIPWWHAYYKNAKEFPTKVVDEIKWPNVTNQWIELFNGG